MDSTNALPYKRLALAIIHQGVKDVEDPRAYPERDAPMHRRDAYSFFHNEWYHQLAEFVGIGSGVLPPAVENTAASQFGVEHRGADIVQ